MTISPVLELRCPFGAVQQSSILRRHGPSQRSGRQPARRPGPCVPQAAQPAGTRCTGRRQGRAAVSAQDVFVAALRQARAEHRVDRLVHQRLIDRALEGRPCAPAKWRTGGGGLLRDTVNGGTQQELLSQDDRSHPSHHLPCVPLLTRGSRAARAWSSKAGRWWPGESERRRAAAAAPAAAAGASCAYIYTRVPYTCSCI
jgi:hypothetical protein